MRARRPNLDDSQGHTKGFYCAHVYIYFRKYVNKA